MPQPVHYVVRLADPWDGYWLIGAGASPEPALMRERDFMLRWTQWEELGMQPHLLAKWHTLAKPGQMLVAH